MKKATKIFALLLIFALVVTCFVGCGGKTSIEISNDGYWVINGEKTEYKAVGADGAPGLDGVDGVTPTIEISDDGYWVINGVKTEQRAVLKDENPQGLDFFPLDDGTYAVGGGKARYLSEIVIPSTYKGKAVTKIAEEGFYDYIALTSIIIPESVTNIDLGAFINCSSLIIYCEAKSKPDGWIEEWNDTASSPMVYSGCPVFWDYKNIDASAIEGVYKLRWYEISGNGSSIIYHLGDEAPWGGVMREDNIIIDIKTGEIAELTSDMGMGQKEVYSGTYLVKGYEISITVEEESIGTTLNGTIIGNQITISFENYGQTTTYLCERVEN